MDVQAYLQRINDHGDLTPNAETLRRLHLAHLLAVPFENLDIHLKRPIVLDEAALFDKIVTRRRGGFCYELNGLFAGLLRELGFKVKMLAAGVIGKEGQFSPLFDHMTLLVTLEKRWLVDVGFGESFRQPLLLDERGAQPQSGHCYRLVADGTNLIYQSQDATGELQHQYRFDLHPYQFSDYQAMCHYNQTSPESHFVQKRICTLATPDGRITLSDLRFIETIDGDRRERLVDTDEYNAILKERFGITL